MLRLSLEALQIVDAIDRRGSFSAAGKELHRVPSTISYTVGKLEDDLGVQVFERNGPRVVLTAAGVELLKEGRYLLKAAQDLEHRVRRVASGWETELAVGMDSMFSACMFHDDVAAFYEVAQQTRLRIVQEALSGAWEAALDRPLDRVQLQRHRAVSVADSARQMAPRTVGLLLGQDTLTVPDMNTKFQYQLAGMGFGFLPEPCARAAIAAGLLVEKAVEEPKPAETFYLAWSSGEAGAALSWWIARMRRHGLLERLVHHLPALPKSI